ncbi:MAG: HEPN domain-containing protein [Chloroflexi bacterium]|nr:HEPN domain-containing protein [Chloroflexota bacterium]
MADGKWEMTNDKLRATKVNRARRAKSQPRATRERRAAYSTSTRPKLTRMESRALADLRARLKEILPNGELKSLILYGSKARGDAHRGSDIDLLLVYDGAHGEKKDTILDAITEIEMQVFARNPRASVDLATLIRSEAELEEEVRLGLPLLHNIAREGIVLEGERVMPEEMDRRHWATEQIEDTKRTLRTARMALADGDIRRPIALAYFAFEGAARAALIAKGVVPKSHRGTQSLFGEHFIRTGLLPKKFAPPFKKMEEDRLDATYTFKKPFTQADAERALVLAEELVRAIEDLLPKLLEAN